MPLVFKASSIKREFVWVFFLNNCVQIEAGKLKDCNRHWYIVFDIVRQIYCSKVAEWF